VLDASLLRQLEKAIGSKERGLFHIGAVIEFYFLWGALPSDAEVRRYGEELAKFRYGASVMKLMIYLDGTFRHIKRAERSLNALKEKAERLQKQITKLCSSDDLLELSARAKSRARSETRLGQPGKSGRILGR
jgi:hypothetical protein